MRKLQNPLSLHTWLFSASILICTVLAPGCSRVDKKTPVLTDAQIHAKNVKQLKALLSRRCYDCHDDDVQKGDLNLTALPMNLDDRKVYDKWVTVFDRIDSGEMPPKKKKPLMPETKQELRFLIGSALKKHDQKVSLARGRTVLRRLNRFEYENSLRDLLDASWLEVREMLPEDGESHHFNKDGRALQVSHVQVASYLNAANYALRQVVADQVSKPQAQTRKYYARQQGPFQFFENSNRGVFPMNLYEAQPDVFFKKKPVTVGSKNPKIREIEAVGVVKSTYEPAEPKFIQFRASRSGRYKLKFKTWTFLAHPKDQKRWWIPGRYKFSKGRRDEPITLYSERPPRQMRKIGGFDSYPDPSIYEMEVDLIKGETVRVDACRFYRVRPGAGQRNPLATKEGTPGVAFAWMEASGPLVSEWPSAGHKLLFDNLPVVKKGNQAEVVSKTPDLDAVRLLERFLEKAYREPFTEKELKGFLAIYNKAVEQGNSFMEAMLLSYSAVLCSPKFIYLNEKPGRLDDGALASRLAFFLTNTHPDKELMKLAASGKLKDEKILSAEAERLLNSNKSARFVNAFLDYWLDLRNLNLNTPDENLYNDYNLDDFLAESVLDETRMFFSELMKNNLPAANIIDSDFAMLNERLTTHYGLPPVKGIKLRKVKLPENTVRGGLITQASILRITANGTNTSPVMRGVWMLERILGQAPPPPPPGVPAVEPDTRGATTIRQLLDKHRKNKNCNACHKKIDPAGFALENFDVYGGWREKYRALPEKGSKNKKVFGFGKNGLPFAFCEAQKVDASGEMADGTGFKDIRDFKKILLKDERQIARNLVSQLVTYATGAAPSFGDREVIEEILDKAKSKNYGVRTVIKEIVLSNLFRFK